MTLCIAAMVAMIVVTLRGLDRRLNEQ
jgi:hypothetical protein